LFASLALLMAAAKKKIKRKRLSLLRPALISGT